MPSDKPIVTAARSSYMLDFFAVDHHFSQIGAFWHTAASSVHAFVFHHFALTATGVNSW